MLASWRYFMGRPVFIPELPEAQRLAEEASVGTSSRFDFSGAYLEKSDEVAFKRMGYTLNFKELRQLRLIFLAPRQEKTISA